MIVIFINYIVNASIAKQTIFLFSNINKLNFRLVRIFVYLFQFRLDIRYRFNKRYVISNALFKLSTKKLFLNKNNNLNLKSYYNDMKDFFVNDQCFAYYEILINMFLIFR